MQLLPEPILILMVLSAVLPGVAYLLGKMGVKKLAEITCALGLVGIALSLYAEFNLLLGTYSGAIYVFSISLLSLYSSLFVVDALSSFLAALLLFISLLIMLFSMKYMRAARNPVEFNTLMLIMLVGMLGVLFAGDLFTLFIFWELMSIASYILVAHEFEGQYSLEAAIKYFYMAAFGSATILLALSFIYNIAGTLNMAALSSAISNALELSWLHFAFALLVLGFGVKATIVPLHMWAPDAYQSAPTPVSAMLASLMKKVGIYGILRLLFLIYPVTFAFHMNWQLILATIAAVTMTLGNLTALLQDDMKRLLAYSSIAHSGYIMLGIAVGTLAGLTGSIFHIFNHAVIKALLFLCVGAFIYATGTANMREIAGIGRKMRATAVMFFLAVLAIVGVPPLNGFWSEFIIIMSALQSEVFTLFAVIMLLNILLSLGYYLRMLKIILWTHPSEELEKRVRKTPASMLIPMAILAFICVFVGLYLRFFVDSFTLIASKVMEINAYAAIIS